MSTKKYLMAKWKQFFDVVAIQWSACHPVAAWCDDSSLDVSGAHVLRERFSVRRSEAALYNRV